MEKERGCQKMQDNRAFQQMLQPAKERVCLHSLEDIARSAAVGRRECLRCFQSLIHKSPFEYLLDYRVETAQRLLRTSSLPILDIALQTGFSNEAYFCKVFKRISGKTPNTYRKAHRRQI